MLEDKTLKCKECGQEFVFTAGEQEFYAQKGFQNEPVRCGPCRQARKRQRASMTGVHFRQQESARRFSIRPGLDRNWR